MIWIRDIHAFGKKSFWFNSIFFSVYGHHYMAITVPHNQRRYICFSIMTILLRTLPSKMWTFWRTRASECWSIHLTLRKKCYWIKSISFQKHVYHGFKSISYRFSNICTYLLVLVVYFYELIANWEKNAIDSKAFLSKRMHTINS